MSKPAFNPQSSTLSATAVVNFLQTNIYEVDLKDIPGVGPKTIEVLEHNGIETTSQLLAQFLQFVGADSDTRDVCNDFFLWLKEIGVTANRHNITFAMANIADEKGVFRYQFE
jgi:hypothetical protein